MAQSPQIICLTCKNQEIWLEIQYSQLPVTRIYVSDSQASHIEQ